jgi:hypothetical protein
MNAFPSAEHNKYAVLAAIHSSAGTLCTRDSLMWSGATEAAAFEQFQAPVAVRRCIASIASSGVSRVPACRRNRLRGPHPPQADAHGPST